MPQAIAETIFDVLYLSFALIAGLIMLIKGKTLLVKKAGLMAALLGAGDSFHLVPRAYALLDNRTGSQCSSAWSWKICHIHYNDNFLSTALLYLA